MSLLKLYVFIIISLISFQFLAQTDVIRTKNRNQDLTHLNEANDNFGLVIDVIYDSIIYIGNHCLVEVKHFGERYHFKDNSNNPTYRDTICDHPLFTYSTGDVKAVRDYYGGRPKVAGFKGKDVEHELPVQNGISGFLIVSALLGGLYTFYKKRNDKKIA